MGRVSCFRPLSARLFVTFLVVSRRTKKKDIYVISTAKRPIPLEHYLYAGKELWKIVDASRTFSNQGYAHHSFASDPVWVLNGRMWFPATKMLGRRCGASKIRNVNLRAFLRFSGWARAPRPRSVGPADCQRAGADHRLEEEDR